MVVSQSDAALAVLVDRAVGGIGGEKRGRMLDFGPLAGNRRQEKCAAAADAIGTANGQCPRPQETTQRRRKAAELILPRERCLDRIAEIVVEARLQPHERFRLGRAEATPE